MSAEAHMRELARQACQLLECGAVSLFLGCAEPGVRHPLLHPLPVSSYSFIGSSGLHAGQLLIQDERIRALCDVAMQSGEVQGGSTVHLNLEDMDIHSVVVAPLERPAGVLGVAVCTDAKAEAFSQGEHTLLAHFIPVLAYNIEQDLRNSPALFPFSQQQTTGQSSAPADPAPGKAPAPGVSAPESDHLKSEFISIICHELRTPLTAIKGYAGLLQAYGITNGGREAAPGEMTPARQQQYLDIIVEQTNHLEVLIRDMLDISRIQAGRLALRRTQVNLALLCQRVVQLVQHRADTQQPGTYTIRCVLEPDLPLAWADPDRVQQVLTNLLENAVKYSPQGGLIEVMASSCLTADLASVAHEHATPSMLHISVRDSGIGISSEQQSQLFKPFSRLEHSATSQIAGIGLGLYITRKLIEAMGGAITLHSSEGEGTCITFTLPIHLPVEANMPQKHPYVPPIATAREYSLP